MDNIKTFCFGWEWGIWWLISFPVFFGK